MCSHEAWVFVRQGEGKSVQISALGHHLDDVVETIMLNVLYAGNYMTMMPILDSTNFEGLKLIRRFVLH